MRPSFTANENLARQITRSASKQTFYTIRYLVDKPRIDDAFCAYAYFRWVDNWIDGGMYNKAERVAFIERQKNLLEGAPGDWPTDLLAEEELLTKLVARNPNRESGLWIYLRSLMKVMAFDADRKGRLVCQRELNEYTEWLSTGVTEALHFFIDHDVPADYYGSRYKAAMGAHITHMLRDALEDSELGYFNIPKEVVDEWKIRPWDVGCKTYRNWVKEQVAEARLCFRDGRESLNRSLSKRRRIAGMGYIKRFEVVLDAIEREGYLLHRNYPSAQVIETLPALIRTAVFSPRADLNPSKISH